MKLIVSVSVFLFFFIFPIFFDMYMLKPHKHTMVRSKFEFEQDLHTATDPILWYNTSP